MINAKVKSVSINVVLDTLRVKIEEMTAKIVVMIIKVINIAEIYFEPVSTCL